MGAIPNHIAVGGGYRKGRIPPTCMKGENDMGVDIMTFPDTVEEFMEQYKMVDREQIYSNGCEYVPIYRMKQWFAHKPQIDLVRCGECKYYFPYKHYDGRILGYHCQAPNQQTDFLEPTHYCGFGERRTDDSNT